MRKKKCIRITSNSRVWPNEHSIAYLPMLLFMQLLKLQRPASLLKQAYQHLSVLTYLALSILCKISSFFPLLEKKTAPYYYCYCHCHFACNNNDALLPMSLWSNGRSLTLIMLSVNVRASIITLWRLVSVFPQLSTNWVETVSLLRNMIGVCTPRSRHHSNIREGLKYLDYLGKCFNELIYDGGLSCLVRL